MSKQRTTLFDCQLAAGARMIDFHGWEMPVQFQGIVAEHNIVRTAAGLFDLGHMGRLHVHGPEALDFLEQRVSRPLGGMKPGQVRYGLICNDKGGVEDDILVSREAADAFHVVVNASNLSKVLSLWSTQTDAVTVENLSAQQAMLAAQGPDSSKVLSELDLNTEGLGYYRFCDQQWEGQPIRLSRTGYTGEDGFECFVAADAAPALWHALVEAGAVPCGLGCRDTLRLEAGMPLYGNELDENHSPVAAGLGFAIGKKKTFNGSTALMQELDTGSAQVLVGLHVEGKRPARHDYPVLHDGQPIGRVTSGSLSPTLGKAIAMAYVDKAHATIGSKVQIDIRGKATAEATVVDMPFYKRQ